MGLKSDAIILSAAAILLIFAFSITPNSMTTNVLTGFAFSSLYSGYAVPIGGIIVDNNISFAGSTDTIQKSLDVSDDIVYRRAYVSYGGQAWSQFNLTPTGTLSGDWIYGRGISNITFSPAILHLNSSRTSSNNTYIIIYSCSKNTTIHNWSCHDGWQIIPFNAVLNSANSGSVSPTITFIAPTPASGSTINTSSQEIVASISDDSNAISSWIDFDKSLIGYWSMDYYNNTGIYDNSTYKNFGTFTGGLSTNNIVTGIRCKGLQFDGIDNSINVKDSNSLDIGTSDFSISFWGNFGTQDRGYSAIIGKKAGSWADTASGYEVIMTDTGKIFLHFSDGNNYVSTSWTSTNFSNAGWKHFVITVNRDGNAIIYVNGIVEKTDDISTAQGSLTNSLNLGIMTRSDGNYAANGLLDEVMIFNRSLSATEVLALYDSKLNKFDATFSNLVNGQHTYSVYAIDGDGNIASSSRTFSVNVTGAVTCSGLNTQTCTITNGVGSQTRTCNNGVWGAPYGTCIVQSCNSGYTQSGSSCIISSMCTNDCSSSGLKQCSGNGYQTCGNYDSDSCLEWSSVTACPNGGTCSGSGNCGVFTGTIHYIDAVSGVDSSTHGSITAPWKTLAYACSQVKTSGDLIHVNAGTYTETSQCNLAVGVSIEGEGINSLIKSNYAGGESEGFISLDSPSGNPVNGNQSISYIKIDGRNNPGSSGISVNFRSNVAIHHITIADFSNYAEGIWFFNNNRGYPLPPTIAYATSNSVHDSTFINSDNRFEGQSGFLYYNNVQTNIVGNVQLLTSDWMKTFIIHDNIFTRTYDPVNWNFWGELYHFSDNSEIYKNIFNGVGSLDLSDVRKGNGAWGLKVYNNQFLVSAVGPDNLNHNVHSINFEGWGALQYIYVFNNYFKNPPAAISVGGSNAANCVYPDGVHWALDHIYIYYNIFENAGNTNNPAAEAIWLWDYAAPGYIYNHIWDNIFIENNVIISTTSPNQIQGIYLSTSTPATNFHIDNNIMTGYPWVPIKFQYGSNFNTISIQNNLFYQNGDNSVSWGSTPSNKIENNLAPVNPSFIDATNGNFHLQPNSPAIDKGINAGLTSDYEGTPVPQGLAPDIGAYEWHP